MGKLNDKFVRGERRRGYYHDGDGLYLQVSPNPKTGQIRKSWVYRYRKDGKTREMGLGRLADVSLGRAREKAQAARDLRASGVDPITNRIECERERRLAAERAKSFKQVAEEYIEAKKPGWKNKKHGQQWTNSLREYAYPVFGTFPVADVTVDDVIKALNPIWTTKEETARRVRSRIEKVLDFAAARKLRSRENPAQWDGTLSALLPRQRRGVRHHKSLPYAEAPAFVAELNEQPGMAAKALRFAILTGARTGEVAGAKWPEFDLDHKLWVVPAERMKNHREHRVPLSTAALQVLREAEAIRGANEHVFGAAKSKRPMSNMALLAVLKRMGLKGRATSHGFRATFRTWAAEKTDFDPSVAEAALAHVAGSKVEQAYMRSDQFEKRKELMQKWSDYLIAPSVKYDPTKKVRRSL
jgi:integrase